MCRLFFYIYDKKFILLISKNKPYQFIIYIIYVIKYLTKKYLTFISLPYNNLNLFTFY